VKPEVLLGRHADLPLEPLCKVCRKVFYVSLDVAGARKIHSLAGDFVSYVGTGKSPRDA
jgi:hypothetical protein